MATNGVLIDAVSLTKRFGRTHAVNSMTFDVGQGETLCIIGPNGAGKTTLLLLLGGVLLPSAGHVHVFGRHRWKENFEIRKQSTFLTAEPIFGACPTPYEYLRFFAQIYELPKGEFLEKVRALSEQMAMIPHLNKPWAKLSLGMMKKAGLIAAFLPEVPLRFLDEPFAGGIDPHGMETLYGWIADARSRGETTLFSTQVLEQAENAADRILLMEDGRIRMLGTPVEIMREAQVDPSEPRALYKAFMALSSPENG